MTFVLYTLKSQVGAYQCLCHPEGMVLSYIPFLLFQAGVAREAGYSHPSTMMILSHFLRHGSKSILPLNMLRKSLTHQR